jgi:Flp pilus assembly protein TadD
VEDSVNRLQKCVMAAAILGLALGSSVSAQTRLRSATPTGPTSPSGLSDPAVVGSSIIVSVVDEAGTPLDKQAIVKLFDEATQSVTWGSTQGRTEAQFDNVKAGQYQIEVSAPGFKTTQQELTATSSHEAYRILVALPLDVSGAVTDIKPGQVLAPRARKEVEKGMAALKQGDLAEAQKHLEEAYKLAPANADVNYLLGVLCVRRKDTAQAQAYLNRAISLDSRHIGALTELGQLLLQQRDFAGAAAVLEPAVLLDPKQWRGHWLLADTYLRQQEFEKARLQAALAIKESKGGAVEARLVLGEALAGLGRKEEAIQALELFLHDEPRSPAAPGVRELIAKLQSASASPVTNKP